MAHPFPRFTFVVPQFTAFPRESYHSYASSDFLPQPLRVPYPSPRLRREGWDGFGLPAESEKLRKENLKLEERSLRRSRPREQHRDADGAQDALRDSGQAGATRERAISNLKPLHCVAYRASDCGHFVPQCRRDDRAISQSHLKFQIEKARQGPRERRRQREITRLRSG